MPHIHIWRATWSLFIGYDFELDQWRFEMNWGGKSTVRGVGGRFWYRNHIRFATRQRSERWFARELA